MKIQQKTQSNYDYFIRADTSPYKGEWISLSNNRIISHGKDADVVYKKAKQKYPAADISLAKVPDEQILVLKQLI